jgi:putative phosphoribosyl transferase
LDECKHYLVSLIFDRITRKFQLKIKDRQSAGNILGEALKQKVKKEDRKNTLVLGIPRGGLIIAEIVARKLACGLDLFIVKRLRSPHNEELAIGAVTEDGTTYLNELIIEELKISQEYIEKEISHQLQEIKRLMQLFNHRNKLANKRNIFDSKNKTIVIVDDGAATGSTIIAAVRSVRKNMNSKRLIIGLPILPKGTISRLNNENIDQIEVITSPQNRNFVSIEQYYQNFDQVTDKQVIEIIQRNSV